MGYDTRRYWNNKEKRAEKAREGGGGRGGEK